MILPEEPGHRPYTSPETITEEIRPHVLPSGYVEEILACAKVFHDSGYWLVPIRARGEHYKKKTNGQLVPAIATGKEPCVTGWGLKRLTWPEIEREIRRVKGRGFGFVLGPGRSPDGLWIADLEVDGPEGETSLLTLLGGEIIDTLRYRSRRGPHTFFLVDGQRLIDLLVKSGAVPKPSEKGKGVFHHPRLLGLELRIGGYHTDGAFKQVQSVAAPCLGDDGQPRVWLSSEMLGTLPESAYRWLDQRALERYGEKALEREAAEFAKKPAGERHPFLLETSCRLASLCKAGMITEQKAKADLLAAAKENGLAAEGRENEVEELWQSGWARVDARQIPTASTPRPAASTNGQPTGDEYATFYLGDFGDVLANVEEELIDWRVEKRLAAGKIHLRIGPGGVGKSTYSLAIAAAMTTQGVYPGAGSFGRAGKVAILGAEDGKEDTMKPRFVAAGGEPSQIFVLKTRITKPGKDNRPIIKHAVFADLDYWKRFFDLWEPDLLIADPVTAYLGRGVNDSKNTEVREILDPFAELLREYGVAFEAITHTPKKIESQHAAEMALGSVAYPNISRIAHVHWVDPENPDHYFMTNPKNIGPKQPTVGYTIGEHSYERNGQIFDTSKIVPDEESTDIRDNDLMQGQRRTKTASHVEKATDWLRERLKAGPVNSTLCSLEGDEALGLRPVRGNDPHAIVKRNARTKWWREVILKPQLDGFAKKHGYQGLWFFCLPNSDWPPSQEESELAEATAQVHPQ
jgi:hypothetical protein